MTDFPAKLTYRLVHDSARQRAVNAVMNAPDGYAVSLMEPKRSREQNDKMWAMITDIQRAKPMGRKHPREVWKCMFMAACGHAVQFEIGLDDKPFPIGFSSSQLNKAQMSDLIEYISWFGAEHGVKFTDPKEHPQQSQRKAS